MIFNTRGVIVLQINPLVEVVNRRCLHVDLSQFCCFQTETASVDADIQKEYARQREHLERSVASLRKKLVKDTEIHRADNVRIMQVGHYP